MGKVISSASLEGQACSTMSLFEWDIELIEPQLVIVHTRCRNLTKATLGES